MKNDYATQTLTSNWLVQLVLYKHNRLKKAEIAH